MWKWLGGIVVLVAAAFFCLGFGDDAKVTYKTHKVKSGETLNGIAAMYHNQNSKGYIGLADYSMMVRVKNNHLHNLERQLQVDDEVKVPIYTVK